MNSNRPDYSYLTKEDNFWALYRLVKKIPANQDNKFLYLGFLIIFIALQLFGQSYLLNEVKNIQNNLSTLTNISITIFGFGLTGYSIFSSLTDKSLQLELSKVPHIDTGLNYLQYTHCLFLKILIQVLKILLVIFILQNIFTLNIVLSFREMFSINSDFVATFIAILNGIVSSFYIYLLLLSKSFVFNVFHCIMMSTRWNAETKSNEK